MESLETCKWFQWKSCLQAFSNPSWKNLAFSNSKLKTQTRCAMCIITHTVREREREHSKSWIHLFSSNFLTRGIYGYGRFSPQTTQNKWFICTVLNMTAEEIFCFQWHVWTGLHVHHQSIKFVLVLYVCVFLTQHNVEQQYVGAHESLENMDSCEWKVFFPMKKSECFHFGYNWKCSRFKYAKIVE